MADVVESDILIGLYLRLLDLFDFGRKLFKLLFEAQSFKVEKCPDFCLELLCFVDFDNCVDIFIGEEQTII